MMQSILIGMKMYKQNLTNKDPTNTKYKFKKAQEFLESFKKKIRDNSKGRRILVNMKIPIFKTIILLALFLTCQFNNLYSKKTCNIKLIQ